MFSFEYGDLNGATGASHTSWQSGPRLVLADVMSEAKDVHNEEAVWKAFITAILPSTARDGFPEDIDWRNLHIVYSYFFKNNYREKLRHYPKPEDEAARKAKAEAEAKAKAEKEAKKAEFRQTLYQEINKRALSLMELVMPNGKKIGDFDRQDALEGSRYMTPWMLKIAARMGPNDIFRNVATENDLREMLAEAQSER